MLSKKVKETLIRILATIVFLPFLYFTMSSSSYNSLYWSILIAVIGVGGIVELYHMFKQKGYNIYPVLLIPITLILYWIYYKGLDYQYVLGLLIFIILIGITIQLLKADFDKVVFNLVLMVFSVIYLGLMWAALIKIKQLSVYHLIVLIATTWFCDIGAYFIGYSIGKHKFNLKASPNKTIEGFLGGIVISLIAGYIACYFTGIKFAWWFFILPIGTIIGDLLESILKRFSGVKDSSNIVPGHGGLLDVFDSLIFNAPIYYFCLQLIG